MNFRYAGLWVRILAFALDYLLIALYLLVVVAVGLGVNRFWPTISERLFANPLSGHLVSFVLVTLPVGLYFALSEASSRQATWGKRRMGLQVVRSDGTRLHLSRSLARTALKFVPWELAHTCIWQVRFADSSQAWLINGGFILVWVLGAIYLVSLIVNKRKQTLYDWLAKTYVIHE